MPGHLRYRLLRLATLPRIPFASSSRWLAKLAMDPEMPRRPRNGLLRLGRPARTPLETE